MQDEDRQVLIANDFGGILPYHEAFYILSIIYAAERADAAFQRFGRAYQNCENSSQAMAALQEALTHAAALARFFWPMKSKNKVTAARGKRLREAFALDDKSALADRELRNALEHFDERLDDYLVQDEVGYFLPMPIVGKHDLADDCQGHIFKLVDPESRICAILGRKFEFRSIQIETCSILDLARQMDANGSRLVAVAHSRPLTS
ncbi:hypothetical protein [Methylocystis sp.]|uniref:hypothetical protein n=1 Tax=Methylocystis sp. TaxID=1911079 RepID=UPI003D0E7FA1